ncbi:MAG: SpoIIE family protein phosphatase, partial [Actinomycetota bacterium]|nr:SpoIIE family protein phosphatase [Actinomycetota bacterium]
VEASQLTDAKDRASEAELFAALAQGTIQEYRLEKRMITASGSKLWVNAIRSSVLGGDGETRYYIEMAEDISTRREAEGRLERSRGLKSSISKIDSSINSTFDIEEIISTAVAEGAEAIGADSAIVTIHEQHGWELRKAWHFPPHDVAPEVPSERIAELVSLETDGLPLVIEDVDDDPRVNVEVARLFGVRSFIVIPLRFRGRSLGMLFFNYSSGPRHFDGDEIAFAVELSSALTMAIENARLYDAEHRTVDAIQASLLAIEGDIPGVEVGTAYYSAMELARIGGDFFDVFALPDDRVAFAVGDVSGKGIEAAAVTALAKSTVRAFAYEWGSPDRVMRATNQALIRQIGESRFVTLIYGLLDVRTGEVRLVCAGHPAPLICDASGCVEDVSIHNPPLGVFDLMEFEEFRTVLHPGMRLVAFSDGLLDARHGEEFLGEDRVRGLV